MYLLLDLHIKSFDTIAVIAIAVIAIAVIAQYKTVALTANALMANKNAVIASAVKARVVEACGSARGLKLFETGCFNMFSRNINIYIYRICQEVAEPSNYQ